MDDIDTAAVAQTIADENASAEELAQGLVEDVLIPDHKVRRRYGGISEMTLWRWDRSPELGFPPPFWVNGRKYRRLRQLLEFDRQAARQHASKAARSVGQDTET